MSDQGTKVTKKVAGNKTTEIIIGAAANKLNTGLASLNAAWDGSFNFIFRD